MANHTYTAGNRIRNRHTLAEGEVREVYEQHVDVLWDAHREQNGIEPEFKVFRSEIEPVPVPAPAQQSELSRDVATIDAWLFPGERLAPTFADGLRIVDAQGRVVSESSVEELLEAIDGPRQLDVINAKLNHIIFKLGERTK